MFCLHRVSVNKKSAFSFSVLFSSKVRIIQPRDHVLRCETCGKRVLLLDGLQ